MEVRIKQLEKLVYVFAKKKKPFMVLGGAGIGKSQTVRAVSKKLASEEKLEYCEDTTNLDDLKKYYLLDLRLAQLEPSDLRGLPFPEQQKYVRWLLPTFLPKDGKGVIFLDEFNTCSPAMQAAALQLILDRKIGDYVVPEGYAIIAAGNRAEDKANVFPISGPLANRFGHATLIPPSKDEWSEWAYENNIRPDIIAFMHFKPSYLYKFNKDSKDLAWPSPRTWAMASDMTLEYDYATKETSNKKQGDKEVLDEEFMVVSCCVGEGVAVEYQGFIKMKNRINLKDVLKNPSIVKKPPISEEVGLKWSLISGLADIYKEDLNKQSKDRNTNAILDVVSELEAEYAVFLLRLMRGVNPKVFAGEIMNQPSWKKVYESVHKYALK